MGVVYKMGVGLGGGREGGLRQEFLGVLLGGRWSSSQREKCYQTFNGFKKYLEKKTGINFYCKNKYAHDAKFVKPHKLKYSFLGMKALR